MSATSPRFGADARLDSLPHRPPMRLITGFAENGAAGDVVAEVAVDAANPFLLPDGTLSRVALAEMLAQAFVAVSATANPGGEAEASPRPGYLVAMKHLRFHGDARPGDALRVRVRPEAALMDFVLFEGVVVRVDPNGETALAEGQLRLYLPGEGAA